MKTIFLSAKFLAFMFLTSLLFLSCKKDGSTDPNDGEVPGVFTGYTYFVTNFDDGWNATLKEDFVELSNAGTTVLIHYGVTLTDELRLDIVNNCWALLSGNRYVVNNLYSYNYSPSSFPYYYLQADVTVNATGESKFVSFLVKTVNGVAYGYEIISNSSAEFLQTFPTMESIENMSGYNKFGVGANDLIGTWQEGSGSFTQYYFVVSGNYAGMNIVVSNLKYIFVNSTAYNTDAKSVSSGGYQHEKETGKYVANTWDVSTTDQNGKVSDFNGWFEAVKGGRILHLWNKQFTGEHYQLGRLK
jgi:hypothetical protein